MIYCRLFGLRLIKLVVEQLHTKMANGTPPCTHVTMVPMATLSEDRCTSRDQHVLIADLGRVVLTNILDFVVTSTKVPGTAKALCSRVL